MGIKSISLAATALVLSSSVNAAIISTDWQTSGDNLITTDTESGLNWLDLTETNGLSYNYVSSQLGVGGQFEGFRYATSDEVVALWANWSIDLAAGASIFSMELDPNVPYASEILGNTLCEFLCTSYPYGTLGFVADTNLFGDHYRIGAYQVNNATSYTTAAVDPVDPDITIGFFCH